MTGGVVSRTVTVNELKALLPCASVAVKCTVVVPIAKVLLRVDKDAVAIADVLVLADSESSCRNSCRGAASASMSPSDRKVSLSWGPET